MSNGLLRIWIFQFKCQLDFFEFSGHRYLKFKCQNSYWRKYKIPGQQNYLVGGWFKIIFKCVTDFWEFEVLNSTASWIFEFSGQRYLKFRCQNSHWGKYIIPGQQNYLEGGWFKIIFKCVTDFWEFEFLHSTSSWIFLTFAGSDFLSWNA